MRTQLLLAAGAFAGVGMLVAPGLWVMGKKKAAILVGVLLLAASGLVMLYAGQLLASGQR
ncbi:MAG: hypothetical protein FJW36_09575 [Acidobacteria bacterium]|nr:hypothetical protein [Acidobacteriota bacterium]